MRIRTMQAADIPQLAKLYEQFWQEKSDIYKMEELYEEIKHAYILLSAMDGDRLVGSVMGVVCAELYGACQPFLVLENMIVDKNSQNQGIGKALYAELENRAKRRGCSQIILVTEKDRAGACKFYEACGFQPKHAGFKKKL